MNSKPSMLKLAAAFSAVYIIWGSTYLGIAFAIETMPVFLMAGSRFFIAGVVLYIAGRMKGGTAPTLTHWKSGIIIGGLLLLGGNGGVVYAEKTVPSGLTALLVSTVPIWVAILTYFNKKQDNPKVKTIIGVILGFIGITILVSPANILNGESVDLFGAGLLCFATFSWAIGSIYSKSAPLPSSMLLTTAVEMISGGLLLMIAGLITGEASSFSFAAISMKSLAAYIYLIIFGSIIAFTAYMWLLGETTPAKATTYAYVNPVVAVILGWLLAGETINMRTIVSTFVIITAVVIIITDFKMLKVGKILNKKD